MKREFLALAKTLKTGQSIPIGIYMSEKLDGVRCFWDGGISRGIPAVGVPFANVEKHGRYKEERVATGLWTRYGQVISAPGWWLDELPHLPLDGELWMGRGRWQDTVSCVKRLEGGPEWREVRYMVFDSPPYAAVFANGRITNVNYKKRFEGVVEWAKSHGGRDLGTKCFSAVLQELQHLPLNKVTEILAQEKVPDGPRARPFVDAGLDRILDAGGEGVMLRVGDSLWEPVRSDKLWKVKGENDMEGTVVGYTWGRETDKGSKLLGMMGSLRLRLDSGKEFDLSGFTEYERVMTGADYGKLHPGERVDVSRFQSVQFAIGSRVTFRYRELSEDGIPKEGRYHRRRPEEL